MTVHHTIELQTNPRTFVVHDFVEGKCVGADYQFQITMAGAIQRVRFEWNHVNQRLRFRRLDVGTQIIVGGVVDSTLALTMLPELPLWCPCGPGILIVLRDVVLVDPDTRAPLTDHAGLVPLPVLHAVFELSQDAPSPWRTRASTDDY